MDISNLSTRQKEVYNKLKLVFEDDNLLVKWLSLPNRSFKNRPPIDILLSGNFDYFDRFLNNTPILE